MHEASLMDNLLHKITALAQTQQASRVTRVSVTLGALSHVSPDHLRLHFSQAAQGTLAAGARLDIETDADATDARALDLWLNSIEVEA